MQFQVDIGKVRAQAEKLYISGQYFCSEAIIATIREAIAPDMPAVLIAAGSGFPIGVGGAQCMCGAISGSVISLGYFFGREHPTTITDPKSLKCLELAYELQDRFKQNHGSLCCFRHLKNVEFGSEEHAKQCACFTGELAALTAEIIAREKGLTITGGSDE